MAQCLDTIGYWVDGAYFNPIVSGLFSLAAVGAVDWRLGLFSLAAACLVCLPLGGIRRRTTRMQQQMQEEKSGLAQCYSDLLGGAEEVRAFGLEGWMEGKTARRAQRLGQTHTQVYLLELFAPRMVHHGLFLDHCGPGGAGRLAGAPRGAALPALCFPHCPWPAK